MSSDAQGVTDGSAIHRAVASGEEATGPPTADAVPTYAPIPAVTSNAESEAPVSANSHVERIR